MPQSGLESVEFARKLREDRFLIMQTSKEEEQIVQNCLEAATRFFRSPLQLKNQAILPRDLGYRPFATEYSESPSNLDQVETFSASKKGASEAEKLIATESRLLYQAMLATIDVFQATAEKVCRNVAANLSPSCSDLFPPSAFTPWSFLQINYSRPNTVNQELINTLHEDGCLITVAFADKPGLELELGNGEFIPITTKPGEVLVMPGEILWLLSGGYISPLFHRVRADPSYSERLSILFFGDIDPRLCQPWVENEVNRGVDIGELVLKNPTRFGLEEWKLDR